MFKNIVNLGKRKSSTFINNKDIIHIKELFTLHKNDMEKILFGGLALSFTVSGFVFTSLKDDIKELKLDNKEISKQFNKLENDNKEISKQFNKLENDNKEIKDIVFKISKKLNIS